MDVMNVAPAMPVMAGNDAPVLNGAFGMAEGCSDFGALFQQCLGEQQNQVLNLVGNLQALDSKELAAFEQILQPSENLMDMEDLDSELVSQLQALLGQLQTLLEQVQQPELLPEEVQELITEFKVDFENLLTQVDSAESLDTLGSEEKGLIQNLELEIAQSFAQLEPYQPKQEFTPTTPVIIEGAEEISNRPEGTPVKVQEKEPNSKEPIQVSHGKMVESQESNAQNLGQESTEDKQSPFATSKPVAEQKASKEREDSELNFSEKMDRNQEEPRLENVQTNETGNESKKGNAEPKVFAIESEPTDSRNTQVQSQSSTQETAKTPELEAPRAHVAERILKHTSAIHQVAHKVQIMVQNGDGKAILRLDPPELGHIEIEVDSRPGEMRVHMTVESESVKQTMESSVASLRESLEQQNVKLEKLEIQVDHAKAEAQAKGQDQAANRKNGGKGNRGMRFAEVIVDQPQSDTGRRLGLNTMELIA